ncbi:hypothetical protein [Deinococcus aquatilis]|jgi:hypothetical protein|uniref:hypothetical protein n=1 Tax=Deinococcus aquatilis TaxID=519440 RepID=UPI00037D8C35|nr:hypothetical protein [Deinococcus aquatilis]
MKVPRVLLASALAAFVPLASAQTLIKFSDPKLPFSFSYPQGWVGIDFKDDTNGVSLLSGKTKPATLVRLLFASKGGRAVNLATEYQNFESGIKTTGATIKLLSSKAASYGGVSGQEREYALTIKEGQLRLRVWYGNGAKNIYSFQLTDTPARYTAASATFSKILNSVRF